MERLAYFSGNFLRNQGELSALLMSNNNEHNNVTLKHSTQQISIIWLGIHVEINVGCGRTTQDSISHLVRDWNPNPHARLQVWGWIWTTFHAGEMQWKNLLSQSDSLKWLMPQGISLISIFSIDFSQAFHHFPETIFLIRLLSGLPSFPWHHYSH